MGGLKITQLLHIIKLYQNIYNKACKYFAYWIHHKIPSTTLILIPNLWTEKLIYN